MENYILPGYLKEPFDFEQYWSFEELQNAIKGKLYLSVIGGRICYSSEPILEILKNDIRLKSAERMSQYIRKLSLVYNHTSVIAHTPVVLKVKPEYVDSKDFWKELGIKVYKWFYNPETKTITFTLRHIVEHLSLLGKRELINELLNDTAERYFDLETENIQKAIANIERSISAKRLAGVLYSDKFWISLAVGLNKDTYVSRVLSHQLVRHTVLNFNQMSQRYVKLNEEAFIVPESIAKHTEALAKYQKVLNEALEVYKVLTDRANGFNIPKEDARFVIPQSIYTRLIVSGTLADVLDFVQKRIEKNAQWEIRKLAKDILDSLNELDNINLQT